MSASPWQPLTQGPPRRQRTASRCVLVWDHWDLTGISLGQAPEPQT
ncbi:unnamed protein product [Gulo gulo]|uniref:Uncharacterized protein n=1 Tax=Gulo gulo TaxID=48420 RepID=A0A9X9LL84_GULGU|nr:unnamed protein product [Gulo gulo]